MDDPRIDTVRLLKIINADPWLHATGILILVKNKKSELPFSVNESNIVSILTFSELEFHLSRVLTILLSNRQVLVQKDFSVNILEKRSGSFIIDNDPSLIPSYVNIITSTLVNERYINISKENGIRIGLTELLTNAIEHGNCEITYDEKSRFLEDHGDICELIAEKNRDPEIGSRKVQFDYSFSDEKLQFTIKDSGKGFDHKKQKFDPKSPVDLLSLHGRGIYLTRLYVDELYYNDAGNESTIIIYPDKHINYNIPEGFLSQKEVEVSAGDVIFREDELSSSLYYIVNGIYEVTLNGTVLAELTPSDVFLGEMSFLLNNKRVASITAKTDGKLISISKRSFINIIKKYPHYGLYIAKLLAKRLSAANMKNVHETLNLKNSE
jgi:anti-sigma regulatory factor (Ser/Thr protein kinase)